MSEYDDGSNAGLEGWWQALTDAQRSELHDLKAGDPFPRQHLTPYSRASLVVYAPAEDESGADLVVNDRLGSFLAKTRGEQQ
jgi:hypothetical protein